MRKLLARRPSPGLVIGLIALVAALAGSAVAAQDKVTSKEIKKNAVKAKHIKTSAVRTAEIQDGQVLGADLGADAVDGSKVAANSLNDSDISDYETFGNSYVKLTATDGPDFDAARGAAPETSLFRKGQLELYAKCFLDAGIDEVYGVVYARTSADGSYLEGEDDLTGGPAFADFLNINTDELDREVENDSASNNSTSNDNEDYTVMSPDGTGATGYVEIAVKNGDLAGGNGLFGAGDVCLFNGTAEG